MTEEQVPNVEEIKSRLGEEIPVDEEPADPQSFKDENEEADVAAELRNLGRQFADTIRTAWQSEERAKVESEIKEGFQSFSAEVNKVMKEVRSSQAAAKAKEEVATVRTKVGEAELGTKTKSGLSQGLHWLSRELANLADQFTPAEKSPDDADSEPAEAEVEEIVIGSKE